jgi:hypothetical protein
MKIKTDDLSADLKLLEVCLPTVNIHPLYSCFKFSAKKVEAYNGVMYAVLDMPECDIEGYVNASMLMTLLGTLAGKELTVSKDKDSIVLKSGSYQGTLSTVVPEKGTEFAEPKSKAATEVLFPSYDLIKFCASIATDGVSNQPHHQGISVCGSTGFCTDGYRLFKFDTKQKDSGLDFIPNSVLSIVQLLDKLPEESLLSDDYFMLDYDFVKYYIVNQVVDKVDMDAQFKSVKKELKLKCSLTVNDNFRDALKRIAAVSRQSLDKTCQVSFDGENLLLESRLETVHLKDSVKIGSNKYRDKWSVFVITDHLQALVDYADVVLFSASDKNMAVFHAEKGKDEYLVTVKIDS